VARAVARTHNQQHVRYDDSRGGMLNPIAGFNLTGLRARLLAIVLLAVVPLTLVLVAYAGAQNSAEQDRARAIVRETLVSSVRAEQDLVARGQATLETFGVTFAIQGRRWDLAQGNADRLRALHPEYSVVAVADASGTLRASSPATSEAVSIADEDLFQRAVASQRLVVSDHRIDPLTGGGTIAVALPVYDGNDALLSVEYVAFEPAGLAARLQSADPATTETLIDGSGTVVAREPSLPGAVGKRYQDATLVRAMLKAAEGSVTVPGLDGVTRDYYFASVFPNGEGSLRLAVGFSPDELLASQRQALATTLSGFIAFGLIALVVAWLVGTYSIYRPAVQLQAVAERLAQGDLSARAEFAERQDEFGALRAEFNSMAESLHAHVTELERAREDLSRLNAELEDRVRRRTADLEASNKELEAFSYSVSHDLRSPLRAIDGFSLALLEDYSGVLGDRGRDDLRRVRDNANRMAELIDSLLQLSRLSRQELRVTDVDLSAVATEVERSLREIDPGRDVTVRIAPDVHGLGDAPLLRIVLENLLGNAWKFTSKHPSGTIEFGSVVVDGETRYLVRDDGAGFDMAYASKLFGAFQRVHGQTEFPGIGIGLATTARIIRRHGGRIWADGEPEKGATFWFTLS
jgi:signal transduction histidine kinase